MDNYNNFTISDSNKREDYEIFIKKRDEEDFISYCPQLNHLVKGKSFEEVYYSLDLLIIQHIKTIDPDAENIIQISLSDNLGIDSLDTKLSFVYEKIMKQNTGEIENISIENTQESYLASESEQIDENEESKVLKNEFEHSPLQEVVASEEKVPFLKDDNKETNIDENLAKKDLTKEEELEDRKKLIGEENIDNDNTETNIDENFAKKEVLKDRKKLTAEENIENDNKETNIDENFAKEEELEDRKKLTVEENIENIKADVDGENFTDDELSKDKKSNFFEDDKELKLNEDALNEEEFDDKAEVIEKEGRKFIRRKLNIFAQYAPKNV